MFVIQHDLSLSVNVGRLHSVMTDIGDGIGKKTHVHDHSLFNEKWKYY